MPAKDSGIGGAAEIRRGFSERLQAAVAEGGHSEKRADLGKLFETSGAMAQYYWTGEKLPSIAKAIDMARKLGVSVEWLLTGRGTRYPDPVDQSLSPEAVTVAQAWMQLPGALRKQVSVMIRGYQDGARAP